jgi:hypothetical protein
MVANQEGAADARGADEGIDVLSDQVRMYHKTLPLLQAPG